MIKFTSKAQEQVKEFQLAFDHPASEVPKAMDVKRALNRSIWTGEEIVEYIHASCENAEQFEFVFELFIEGLREAYVKSSSQEFPQNERERVVAQADALTDQLYFTYGSAVEIGVDIQPVLDIVQAANMSKLFTKEDGTKYAKYREDGKILKSPEFFSPEKLIEEEIQNQINKAMIK